MDLLYFGYPPDVRFLKTVFKEISNNLFLRRSETEISNFFSSLFDGVSWDKLNEPCPVFVRRRYPIEITPRTFHFFVFFQRNRSTRKFDGAIFRPKMPKPRCFWRAVTSVWGRDEGKSRFDVSLKYWKMSTTIKNDSVINCFYATLIWIQK